MELHLVQAPQPPEFNNSAGRLLSLLQLLESKKDYFTTTALLYGQPDNAPKDVKARTYVAFMAMVGRAFDEFIVDIETSPQIPDSTRSVIKEGIVNLVQCAFPTEVGNVPRKLQEAEVALLRMAGSILEAELDLPDSDAESIRQSLDALRKELESSELKNSARTALLELVRLSRSALDHYTIYGARGFRDAFRKMLSELMEVYLAEGKDVTTQSWWNKAVIHIKNVDAVAAKLLKYKPLLENAATIFIGPS